MKNEKVLLPSIIAVLTLIVLVAGATYAYFAVAVNQSGFSTRTVSASAADVGTVVIQSGGNLRLAVSAADMMNPASADKPYYAVLKTNENQSVVPTRSESQVAPTIATVSTTSSNTFTCTVNLVISYDNNDHGMITALTGMTSPEPTTGQLLLKINDQATPFDLFTEFTGHTSFNTSVTLTGITTGTSRDITAELKLVNKYGNDGNLVANSQNDLANTSMTLNIDLAQTNGITCTAVTPSAS